MYEHSYASIPNRGSHKGKRVIEKWISKNDRNMKYILKMDIKKFFDSIPHDKLKERFSKYIKDDKILTIINEIIDVQPNGLPLGFYTSQWFANWYLQPLDHYIKENLSVVYYIRYMDDMVCFGSNKRELHRIKIAIENYLNNELGIELKNNWQIYLFSYIDKNGNPRGRDLDFMGFRFYRNRTVIRKSILQKMRRKAIRISKKEKPTIYDCKQMLSYLGWITHTDTYNYYFKYIKPCVCFQALKRRVSKYDKKQQRRR